MFFLENYRIIRYCRPHKQFSCIARNGIKRVNLQRIEL